MKLKKYKIFEADRFTPYDEYDDEEFFGTRGGQDEYDKYYGNIPDESEEEEEDDMDTLCYLLRQMFQNTDRDVEVESEKKNILITVLMNDEEQLSDVNEIFAIVRRIESEILPMYETSFEIWQTKWDKKTKKRNTMITFNFDFDDDSKEVDGNSIFYANNRNFY